MTVRANIFSRVDPEGILRHICWNVCYPLTRPSPIRLPTLNFDRQTAA